MPFIKTFALIAALVLGGCAAIDRLTPTPGSQVNDIAHKQTATKNTDPSAPETAILKPFPPEEPPPVITAIPDFGSAN